MPDYWGNPIPGVDTVFDYFGNVVAPTAAQAQAINASFREAAVLGIPTPSQASVVQNIPPQVSGADYANFINATYQQNQVNAQQEQTNKILAAAGITPEYSSVGVGPTYITTPQGIVTVPAAANAQDQTAQNIALFGTPQPGTQTLQNVNTLGTNPAYLAAANQYLQNTNPGAPQPKFGDIGASGMMWSGSGWGNPDTVRANNPGAFVSSLPPVYGPQQQQIVNPYDPLYEAGRYSKFQQENPTAAYMAAPKGGGAYNMVMEAERTKTFLDPNIIKTAIRQGYRGGNFGMIPGMIPVDSKGNYVPSQSVVPSYNSTPGGNMVTDTSGRTMFVPFVNTNTAMVGGGNVFVPLSGNEQQLRENAKMRYNDFGAYDVAQVVPSTTPGFTRIYPMIVAGGGTGALMGGTTSGKALTPLVYDSYGLTPLFDASNPTYMDMLNNPQNYSRLGSEVYGGKVQKLDGRTLQGEFLKGNTIMPGRFAQDSMNYSNLVNFGAVNTAKQNMGNSELPLYAQSSFSTTPLFQKMNTKTGVLEAVFPNWTPVVSRVVPYEQPEFILTRGEPVATIYRQAPTPSRLDSDKYQRPGGMALINNPNWDVTKELAGNAMAAANADEMFTDYARNPKFITQTWMEPQPYKLVKNPLWPGNLPQSAVVEPSGYVFTSIGQPIKTSPLTETQIKSNDFWNAGKNTGGSAFVQMGAGMNVPVAQTKEPVLSAGMGPVTGFGSIMNAPIVSMGKPIKGDGTAVVPGSFSMETTTTKSEPSVGNFLLNYYGGLGNILSGFIGQQPFKTDYGFGETKITTKYQLDTGIRNRADLPKTGGVDFNPVFIGADNKPTSILTEKSGEPFMIDGLQYQNYQTADLSKTSGIFNVSNTETIKEKSVKDNWNAAISNLIPAMAIDAKPAVYQGETAFGMKSTKNSPLANAYNYGSAFTFGFYNDFQKKPLDAAQNAAIAVMISAATGGFGTAATSAAQGTWLAPVVSGIGKYGGKAMGLAYGGSVVGRSTDMFTDYSPAAAERLGGITSTEILPFIIGAGLYSKAAQADARVRTTDVGAPASSRGGPTSNTRTFMDIYSDVASPEYNPTLVAKLRARGVTGGAGNMGTNIESPRFDINTGEELGIFAKAGKGGVPTGAPAPKIPFDIVPSKGVKTPMVIRGVAEPVAMTTLYRGEAPGLGYSTPEKGLWFTDVPAYASGYSGETGKIFSVNVPTAKLSNYFVQERNLIVGKNTANEYLLPESIAQQRILYTGERDLRGARAVTSPVAMPSAMGVPMMNVVSPRPSGGIYGRFSRATTPSPTAYLDALPVILPGRGMATTYSEGGLPSYKVRIKSIETQKRISTNLYGMPENMVVGATVPFKLPSGIPRGFEKWNGILLEGGGEGSSGGNSARSVAKSGVVSKPQSLLKIKRLGEDEFVKRRPSISNTPSLNTAENAAVLSVEGIGIIATPLLFSAPKPLPVYAAIPKVYNRMLYDSSVLTGSETVFGPLSKVGIKAKVSPTSGPSGTSRSETTPSGITLPSSGTSSKLAVGVSPAMGVLPVFGTMGRSGTKSIVSSKMGSKTLSDSLSISKMISEAKPISDGVATSDAKSIAEPAADVMSLPSSLPITATIPIVTPRIKPEVGLAPPDEIIKKVPKPKLPVPPMWPGGISFGGGSSGSAGGVRGRVYRETLTYNFGLKSQKKGLLKLGGTGLGSVGKNTMFGGNYEALLKINVPSVKKPIVTKPTTKKTPSKKQTTSTNGFTLNNLKSITLPSSLPTKKKKNK